MTKKLALGTTLILVLAAAVAMGFQNRNGGNANRRPTPSTNTNSSGRHPSSTAPSVDILARTFEGPPLIFLGILSAVALLIGAIIGAIKEEDARALYRALEAALLAFIGGFVARTFIGLLLGLANDSPGAGLAIGWGFFLWPGLIDTFPFLADKQVLTKPEVLLWIAAVVGGLTGMMDGIWRIHDWKGLGWLSFPLDVTWGLAANTNALLLHLVNFAWAGHADERRTGAHRYNSGFRVKGSFAFTQGSVMSNLSNPPGDPLFKHERTHVWQNRGFGPFFILSYIGWMVTWFIPGLIAGSIVGAGPFQGVEKWCYFNNPWEAWGYAVQHASRTNIVGVTPQSAKLIWPATFVILWAIAFFAACTVLIGVIVANVWG